MTQREAIIQDLLAREWSAKDLAAGPHTSLATVYNIIAETPQPERWNLEVIAQWLEERHVQLGYKNPRVARAGSWLHLLVLAGGGYSKAERLKDARWVDGAGVADFEGTRSKPKKWTWEKPKFYDLRMTTCSELMPEKLEWWSVSTHRDRAGSWMVEATVDTNIRRCRCSMSRGGGACWLTPVGMLG